LDWDAAIKALTGVLDLQSTAPLILVMATIAIHCHLSSVLDVLGDVLFFLLFFSERRLSMYKTAPFSTEGNLAMTSVRHHRLSAQE